jgi:predicted nucleic acid-binding protein
LNVRPLAELRVVDGQTAGAHGLTVLSRNAAEFRRFEGIKVLDWSRPAR